jgi:hypothetical protein
MYTHFMRGDWERAMESDTEDLKWVTNYVLPIIGRPQDAIDSYRRVAQQPVPRMVVLMTTGMREALEGRRTAAVAAISEFTSRPFDPEGVFFMARILVRLGEHVPALELLERVVEEGFFCPQILLRDPWLDPVRSERRFNGIVARARARAQDAEAEFHRLGGDQLLSLS